MAPVSLRSPEELGHMWENFLIAERIKRNDYAGRTFVQHKRVGAPASFTAAYPDAHFECVTPSDLMSFLM